MTRQWRSVWKAFGWGVVTLAAVLGGCAAESGPTADLPRLEELGPSTSKPESNEADESEEAARPAPTVVVHQLIFPRESPLIDEALAGLAPPDWREAMVENYRRNGFIVAAVARAELPGLGAELPAALSVDAVMIQAAANYTPITLVGRITGALAVEYFDGARPNRLRMSNGILRLLVQLQPPAMGEVDPALVLLPQQHVRRPTLLPRSPGEKMMDGRLFKALRVDVLLPPDRAWIIRPDLPLAEPKRKTSEDAPDDAEEQASPEGRDVEWVEPADAPLPLGRAMLAGMRRGRPVQVVLIVYRMD